MGRGSRAPCGCGAWALGERGVRGPRYTGALAAARAGGRNSGCGAAPLPGRTPLPFIGRDPTPVSYTHLDVYKRQVQERMNARADTLVSGMSMFLPRNGPMTVMIPRTTQASLGAPDFSSTSAN